MNRSFISVLVISMVFFAGCSTRGNKAYIKRNYSEPVTYSDNDSKHSPVMDKKTYSHPTMKPYEIMGIKYYPKTVEVGETFSGNASWYGPDFHGKLTSNGEIYDMHDMTAAHKTLPMNTVVKVTNKNNGLSIVVRINDRGPFVATRIIDLSKTGAKKLDMIGDGTAPVSLEVLGFETKNFAKKPAPKNGYAIQIASFSKIDGAIRTQEKYDNKDGYRTLIKDIENDNGRIFKVLLKGFKTEEEAIEYKSGSIFENAFIVRED